MDRGLSLADQALVAVDRAMVARKTRPKSPSAAPFARVAVADVFASPPPAPKFWVDGLVPAGAVTLFTGHGGVGKSWLMLQLAVALAAGIGFVGLKTRRARVLFYSAEDNGDVLRHRLHRILLRMGLEPGDIGERLHIIDATLADPALYRQSGRRAGPTPTRAALRAYIEEHAIDVLLVDNAADTFVADEIDRARVREFMRQCVQLVPSDGAVIVLAHVDKAHATGARSGEGYSGSTAWSNSARSRFVLMRERDGDGLLLRHEKVNHGSLLSEMRMVWFDGLIEPAGGRGAVAALGERTTAVAVVEVVAEFASRGEWVSTAATGPGNAAQTIRGSLPAAARGRDVIQALRTAERAGWLEREAYVTPARKSRERWRVTPDGRAAVGLAPAAPVAPVAPVPGTGAAFATGNRPAPVAPVRRGGCGGNGALAQLAHGGAAGTSS